jgi:predicted MFS family arabinose efflux permease
VPSSYRRLAADPVLRRLAAADVMARVPQGMLSMTVLLAVSWHSSLRTAGLVLAAHTVGQSVTGPLRGRLADRRGLYQVSALCGAAYAIALAGLLTMSLAHAPALVMAGTGAAAGLVLPPLSPGLRGLWARHSAEDLRPAAFAVDAAVFDLSFLAGPILASALATGVSPAAAVIVVLVLTAAAIAVIRPHARDAGSPARPGRPRAPRRARMLMNLLVTAFFANAALSATEVALTAYARAHDALWASGPLLAGISAGSITWSLLLGARPRSGDDRWRLCRRLGAYAAGLAVLSAASLYAPLLAVAVPLAGLFLGPTLATVFTAAATAATPGGESATQAWLTSIMNGGAAAGAAIAGLAAARPILGLATAAAAAALGTATAAYAAVTRQGRHAFGHGGGPWPLAAEERK